MFSFSNETKGEEALSSSPTENDSKKQKGGS